VDDSFTQAGSFELGIWHPFALSSNKQNREGYKTLRDSRNSYRSGVPRVQRQEAIDAVQSFVDETRDLIAALREGGSDLTSTSGPLHIILFLDPDGSARIALSIAELAQRHGLVFYDPQADLLTISPLQLPELERLSASSEMATACREEATIIAVGPWTVHAFVETTRTSYERIKESGSAGCGCDDCSNFIQARDQAYPPKILGVFDALGIDFRKESEVQYYGRTSAGLHTYRGWFYLAGLVESGPEPWHHPPEGKPEKRFYRVGSGFELGLKKKLDFGFSEWETILIDAGFADGPVVEIDFYADLPWTSEAPEPKE
jgi:hypothetical protein